MEQPREGKEAQRLHRWVDKLLPVCGHEEPDGGYGQMAPAQNPSGVLEAMEESAGEI